MLTSPNPSFVRRGIRRRSLPLTKRELEGVGANTVTVCPFFAKYLAIPVKYRSMPPTRGGQCSVITQICMPVSYTNMPLQASRHGSSTSGFSEMSTLVPLQSHTRLARSFPRNDRYTLWIHGTDL